MMLKHYRKEFRRPPNPSAKHLRCVAYFDENISDVLPYLNTVLRGHQYITDPPSLTLKFDGKLITIYSQEIAINIVKDMAEADNILEWLKQEINNTWKRRDQIKPSFSVAQKPDILNSSQTIAQNQLQRMRPAYVYGVCIIGNRGEKKA